MANRLEAKRNRMKKVTRAEKTRRNKKRDEERRRLINDLKREEAKGNAVS